LSLPRTLAHALAGPVLLFALTFGATVQEPAPAAQGSASTPQVPASTTPARLVVTLTGGKGRAAPEPKREDLRVFVDGVERPVVSFEKEVLPVSYGLVVDNSGSLRSQIDRVIAAAKFIVDNDSPGDEAFVLRFVSSDNIQILQNLTADRLALGKALDSMVVQGGQTALLDALHLAGDYLIKNADRGGAHRRRLALILVSDGEDRRSVNKAEQVLKLLKGGGVQVYSIGLTAELDRGGGFMQPSKRQASKGLLMKLASETGGQVFYVEEGGELEEAVGEVVENMRTRYVVSYEPPAPAAQVSGKGRGKVEVKLVGAPGKEKMKAHVVAPADEKE
jgi:VWFA-related protein